MNKREDSSLEKNKIHDKPATGSENESAKAKKSAPQNARRAGEAEDFSGIYRLLAEQSSDIMLFFRTDGKIVEANRAAVEKYGYTREELLEKSFYDIRDEETWAEIPGQMRRAEKGAFRFETVHRRRDGTRFPVEAVWSLTEIGGEPLILSIIRDITERKTSEADLRESRHFIKQIIEIVPSVVYIRDLSERKNIFVNRSVSDALGYSHDEVVALGENFAKAVMHPDDYARIPDREGKFENIKDNEIVEFEYRMRHKSGEWRWFLSRDSVFLRDAEGKPRQVIGTATDITTRKNTEEKLRESEDRFHLAFSAVQSVIYDWNIIEDTIMRSEQLKNLLGFDNGEPSVATNAWYISRLHPDDEKRAVQVVRNAIESGAERFEDEYRLRHKDGHYLWVRDSGIFLKDAAGKTVRCIGSVRDIDHRKQAEIALQISEERLSLAMKGAQVGAFDWNIKTGEIRWSSETEESAAMSADKFNNSFDGFVKLIHPFDRQIFRERIESAFRDGEYECEFRMLKGDGTIRWVIGKGRVYFDDAGNPARLIGVDIDITKRKLAEEALLESRRFTESVIETAPSVIYLFDVKSNRSTYLTAQAGNALGYSVEELKAVETSFLKRFMHPEDMHKLRDHFQKLDQASNGEIFEFEYRMQHKSGEWRWFRSRDRVFRRDENGAAREILGTALDVTEHKEAEEALRESQLQTHLALETANTIAFNWDIKTDVVRRLHSGVEALPETENDKLADVVQRILEADRQNFLDNLNHALANPHLPYKAEYRLLTPDGKIAWLSESGRFTIDENGNPVMLNGISAEITERKQAEDALRASEARLHLGVQVADFAIAQIDYATGTNHLSKEAARLYDLGDDAVSVRREEVHATFHPDDREEIERLIKQALDYSGGGWLALEHRIVRKNGELRWLNVRKQIFFDESGDPPVPTIGILAAQDVTERKIAEETRRQFVSLIEQTSDFVGMGTFEGDSLYVNPAGLDLVGLDDLDAALAAKIADYHPEHIQKMIAEKIFPHVLEHGIWEGESQFRHFKTNELIDIYQKIFLIRHPKTNQPICMATTAVDITEQKRADAALRAAHNTFRHLVENSPFGIYVVDADFRLAQVGAGAQRVFENVRPLIGRDFAEVLRVVWAEPFASQVIAIFRRTLETGEPYHSPRTIEQRGDIGETETYDWKIERITLPDGRFGVVCHFYDLSERQRYEVELQKSEERFRLASDAAAALVYDADLTGGRSTIAHGLERVTGYTSDESDLSSRWWHSLIHPDDLPAHLENYERHLKAGSTYKAVYRVRRKDGAWIWVEDTAQIIKNEAGEPVQLVGAVVDITERKEAEEALRYQLQLTQNITDTAAVAIFVSDRDGLVSFLNPEAEKIFGYSLSEIAGRNLHDAIHYKHPDGSIFPQDECPLARVYENGKAVRDYEGTFYRKDGTPVSIICSNTPVFENGEITGEVMAMLDVTARREQAEKIRISEERYRALVEASSQVVWTMNADGSGDSHLQWFAELTGEPIEEIRKRGYLEFIHPNDRKNLQDVWRRVREKPEPFEVEFRLVPKGNGYHYYSLRGVPLFNSDGVLREWIGTVRDITEPKFAEEKIRESEERFRLLTENLDNVFWILNWKEKRSEYVSPALSRIYGDDYAETFAEFENWTDIIHSEDREKVERELISIEQTGRYESTYRILLPDGRMRWRHSKGNSR